MTLRPPPRRRRRALRATPAAERLEPRAVPAVVGLTVSASPEILRPIVPSNQPHAVTVQHVLPVTIAGEAAVTGLHGTPTLRYRVVDSYGRDQPAGTIAAQPVGHGRAFFSARIGLSILRDPRSPGGRRYKVIVSASEGGVTRQAEAVVTVPPAGFLVGAARHRPVKRLA